VGRKGQGDHGKLQFFFGQKKSGRGRGGKDGKNGVGGKKRVHPRGSHGKFLKGHRKEIGKT